MIHLFLLWSAVVSSVVAQTYRVNTNGPAFDDNGISWSTDAFFQNTGGTYISSNMIIDTSGPGVTKQLLYQVRRAILRLLR
jgi:hypothetical protein